MEEQRYEFWPDIIAGELIRKWKAYEQVIVTGTSMSGDPHIGNANDVIRGDAIARSVKDLGKRSKLIWISDDMDCFRSVPEGMPKELENYLGVPASNIPDIFDGSHKSFADHFEQKFLEQLEMVYVKPKILLAIDMYKKGMYNSVMKVAISKRKEIAEILNKFRTIPLSEDWYPIDVVCDKCGKIATTKILNYDEKTSNVEYVCNPDMILLHRKNPVQGCGHTGKKSILNGGAKLTWRVEWAARWTFLKATCEPFGKEHSAAGGSWDTAKEIVKIFDRNPPYPVEYEHFLVNGEKMSKSKGNVISLLDMLQYMKPEHLRYWMYQGRLTIAKDINLKNMIPRLFDEFNKSEKIFFGKYSTENKRKDNNYKRAYQLSNYIIPKRPSFYIEFEKMLELVKILPEKDQLDFVILKLKEWDSSIKVSPFDKDDLSKELGFVKKYYSKFMRSEITGMKLNENERYVIKDLIKSIQQSKNVEELQESIFEIPGEHNMSMGEFFKVIYEILLNSNRGPKLGPYIFQVGKEEIIKKLESVL